MTDPTDADRAKAAESLTALEWLRVTHADTLSGRRIEEAIASERAAAVADLRARVEAILRQVETAEDESTTAERRLVRRLRAAVTDVTGDPA